MAYSPAAILHDPLQSIDAATKYVRDLNSMFDGRIDLVLAGYNAGENAVINSDYEVPHNGAFSTAI